MKVKPKKPQEMPLILEWIEYLYVSGSRLSW